MYIKYAQYIGKVFTLIELFWNTLISLIACQLYKYVLQLIIASYSRV